MCANEETVASLLVIPFNQENELEQFSTFYAHVLRYIFKIQNYNFNRRFKSCASITHCDLDLKTKTGSRSLSGCIYLG